MKHPNPAPLRLTVPAMGSNTNIKRFRPRVTVEAIQYDGTNATEIANWAGQSIVSQIPHDTDLWLAVAPNGMDRVIVGDWIIRGTTGGYFSRSAEQFVKDYSPEPETQELTPEQRIGAAQLRVMAAQRAALQAEAELENAKRAASRLAVEVRQDMDRVTQMNRAAQLESFDSFTETVENLSPNAQRIVNAPITYTVTPEQADAVRRLTEDLP